MDQSTLKGDESTEKQAFGLESAGTQNEDSSKPGKGPFGRMQENVAKYTARLKDGRETGSDGDAVRMFNVPNGTK